MTKTIVINSGKGGVGKTTTCAAIGLGLALLDYKVALLDFDFGLPKLNLITVEDKKIIYDFFDVVQGYSKLKHALVKSKYSNNLFVLPAAGNKDKTVLHTDAILEVIEALKEERFDFILCDSPAGMDHGAKMAMYYADQAIVVVNPEVSSVRDADKIIYMNKRESLRANLEIEPIEQYLLITRYQKDRVYQNEMLAVTDIQGILETPIIGIIPESHFVLKASYQGMPVILYKKSIIAQLYQEVIQRILGETIPLRILDERKNFWDIFNF